MTELKLIHISPPHSSDHESEVEMTVPSQSHRRSHPHHTATYDNPVSLRLRLPPPGLSVGVTKTSHKLQTLTTRDPT